MMGLLTVFIGLATLGFVQIGVMANWLGAQNAVFICSIQGMVVLIAVVKFIPEIFHRQTSSQEESLTSKGQGGKINFREFFMGIHWIFQELVCPSAMGLAEDIHQDDPGDDHG